MKVTKFHDSLIKAVASGLIVLAITSITLEFLGINLDVHSIFFHLQAIPAMIIAIKIFYFLMDKPEKVWRSYH